MHMKLRFVDSVGKLYCSIANSRKHVLNGMLNEKLFSNSLVYSFSCISGQQPVSLGTKVLSALYPALCVCTASHLIINNMQRIDRLPVHRLSCIKHWSSCM